MVEPVSLRKVRGLYFLSNNIRFQITYMMMYFLDKMSLSNLLKNSRMPKTYTILLYFY